MTGDDPDPSVGNESPAPGVANYPDSLCRIAEDGGYEIHAYEPVTDLCHRSWDLGTRVTATIRRAVGADEPGSTVHIAPGGLAKKVARTLNSPFKQPYTEIDEGRREAFNDFIAGLPASKRSFSLLHVTLPHVHWMYLPDGRSYTNFRAYGETQLISPSSAGEIDRDAQQMMLQLQFTDRELGRLIHKMKVDGTWDESLFVVTADHGAGFLKGGSRRMLGLDNAGWIMPVPFFVKFPGQAKGHVIPGTVTGRDIAPTVMSTLGLDRLPAMHGRDLTARDRLPRESTSEIHSAMGGMTEMGLPDVRSKRVQASRFMDNLFGHSWYALGSHANLLGRRPTELTELQTAPTDPSLYENVDTGSDELPAYYQAALSIPGNRNPGPLAIALNDRIAATTIPWLAGGFWYTGVILPPDKFRDGRNEIRVYEIESGR